MKLYGDCHCSACHHPTQPSAKKTPKSSLSSRLFQSFQPFVHWIIWKLYCYNIWDVNCVMFFSKIVTKILLLLLYSDKFHILNCSVPVMWVTSCSNHSMAKVFHGFLLQNLPPSHRELKAFYMDKQAFNWFLIENYRR